MRIRMNCPNCGALRSAPAEWHGRKVQCNDCGGTFTLTEQPTASSTESVIPDAHSTLKEDSTGDKTANAGVPMKSDPLKVEELVDMTAMVDIVFFLLIFFLVTAMQQIVSSMDMGQSVAPGQTDRPGKSVVVNQSQQQQLKVRIDADDMIWVDDEQIPNDTDLRVRMRDKLGEGTEQMLVVAHDEAHSFSLVTVLDAGYEAGFQDIQMSVLTEDDWQAQGF